MKFLLIKHTHIQLLQFIVIVVVVSVINYNLIDYHLVL
jgi:hypothetical protein